MKEGHPNWFVFHNIFIWNTVFSVALLIRYLIGFHGIWIHPHLEGYYFAVNFYFFCSNTSIMTKEWCKCSHLYAVVTFIIYRKHFLVYEIACLNCRKIIPLKNIIKWEKRTYRGSLAIIENKKQFSSFLLCLFKFGNILSR